jgi:Stage II sporulation protein E (SpoIIE)
LLAARAADEAVRVFVERPTVENTALIEYMHGALRSTRGASLALAEIDHAEKILRYNGVGNISATIWNDQSSRSLVSHSGTIGHEVQTVREFTYPWSTTAMLIMHSDGLMSRWKIGSHPGLAMRHPSIIAGVLFRDYQRGKDDVTVLVARERRG